MEEQERTRHVADILSTASHDRLTAEFATGQGVLVRTTAGGSDANEVTGAVTKEDDDKDDSKEKGVFGTKGDLVLSCDAAQFALDVSCWNTICGICCCRHDSIEICPQCQVIGRCPSCLTDPRHDRECGTLRAWAAALHSMQETSSYLSASCSHLLTVRLLCARVEDWWTPFTYLYEAPIPPSDASLIDRLVASLQSKQSSFKSTVTSDLYRFVLGRVLGCSHAVTDVSLPLGEQTLGRAIFVQHSFYNHSCRPNAYLSCCILGNNRDSNLGSDRSDMPRGLPGRVHLLGSVSVGDPISLSYIPMSGLSVSERQSRLLSSYGFACQCPVCRESPAPISLPSDADVDPIREIQYGCNGRLVQLQQRRSACGEDDTDELENIVSTVRMTQRGMENQKVPSCHEVSIEAHRLLALSLALLGQVEESKQHHEEFFRRAAEITGLFDPVAIATQRLEHATISKDEAKHQEEHEVAIRELRLLLGKDHPWVRSLSDAILVNPPPSKKPRRKSDEDGALLHH